MRVSARTVVAAGALIALSAGIARADEAAIAYRQAIYKSIGGHTQALGAILKREVPYTEDAAAHARALANIAPMIRHIFPEDSREGDTRALPAIWEEPEAFREAQDQFIERSAAVGEAADEDLGALAAAFSDMVKTCKTCHDDFRKKVD